jgi:hypothetical protein
MKLLTRIVVLVGIVSGPFGSRLAHAAASAGVNGKNTGTTSAISVTMSGSMTSGSLLVAVITQNAPGGSFGSLTLPSVSWVCPAGLVATQGTAVRASICYLENNSSTGTTVGTFSAGSTTGTIFGVQVLELKGMQTSSSLDGTGTANQANGTASSLSVSSTSSSSPDVAVVAFANDDSTNPATWSNSDGTYTSLTANNVSGGFNQLMSHKITVGSGSNSDSGSIGGNKKPAMVAVMATFKVATSTYYWIGGNATNGAACTTAGNVTSSGSCWSTSSGGAAAGATPGSIDSVVFDSGGTGNCSINATFSVYSILIMGTGAAYTGTITQGAFNVTLTDGLAMQSGTTGTYQAATANTLTMSGDLNVAAGTFTNRGGALSVRALTLSGGTFTQSSSSVTASSTGTLSGGTFTGGSATISFTGLVTASSGTVSFGSNTNTFSAGLTVSGATVTLSTGTTNITGDLTISSGSVSSGGTVSATGKLSQSGGTASVTAGSVTLGTSVAALSSSLTMTAGTFTQSAGTLTTTNGTTTDLSGTATFNGTGATQNLKGALNVTGGTMTLGTASMNSTRSGGGNPGNAGTDHLISVTSGGTLAFATSFTFPQTATAMTMAGTLNAGTGTITFSTQNTVTISGTYNANSSTTSFGSTDPVTLSGTYNAGSVSTTFNAAVTLSGTYNANTSTTSRFATTTALSGTFNANSSSAVTFTGVVTFSGSGAFNGNTGTTTFTAAPSLSAGTITIGDAASSGSVTFTAGASFATGSTLAFPTSGGNLKLPDGTALTLSGGTVTSSAGTASTLPKVSISGAVTNGISVVFTTGTLNVDGLEFDNVVTTGVSIASAVTLTNLAHLTFKNNKAAGAAGSRHLSVTLGTATVRVPGCFFDATAAGNVKLIGTTNNTARMIFDFQSTTVNGAGAGESLDDDGDVSPVDNIGETLTTYFGSVIEWVYAAPTDTSGTATGPPIAVFNWNTFAYLGIYAAYNNISGGSTDRLWKRNADGTAAYYVDIATVDSTATDMIGNPSFDTIASESAIGVDVDGDNVLSTNVDKQVVYLVTANGHVIKLIDTGTAFVLPGTFSTWHTPFSDSNVTSFTSPMVDDRTNIYVGGTGGGATKMFGVQIASGAEKTLAKNVSLTGTGAISTAPSGAIYNGSTYLFFGSAAVSSQAYIYRLNISAGTPVESSYTGSTTSINGGVNLINSRVYAVNNAGRLYGLDPATGTGSFTLLSGFPYAGSGSPALFAPYADYQTNYVYYGDNAGNVHIVKADGTAFQTISPGLFTYPYTLPAAVTSMPYCGDLDALLSKDERHHRGGRLGRLRVLHQPPERLRDGRDPEEVLRRHGQRHLGLVQLERLEVHGGQQRRQAGLHRPRRRRRRRQHGVASCRATPRPYRRRRRRTFIGRSSTRPWGYSPSVEPGGSRPQVRGVADRWLSDGGPTCVLAA